LENKDINMDEIMENKDINMDEIMEISKDKNAIAIPQIENVIAPSAFTEKVDVLKDKVLEKAQSNEKFVQNITKNVEDATITLVEVEKEKAVLEKQNIIYVQELLETNQKLNEFKQSTDQWQNKRDKRQYHYDGVKPIMEFVGIKTSMNLIILYILVSVLMPFFLGGKFLKGTVGNLICGIGDGSRTKSVKGFLATILALVILFGAGCGAMILLKFIGII
jgi:hypothetical protein